jgi:2-aminophenol/2-amino-5-chlorophenol 1,6-dioxygenase alpha subunit
MAIVSAFIVPGSPLHYLCPDNPPWKPMVAAYETAREKLAASRPDVIAIYSTQWLAVLDQLWQTRPHLEGVHVDENWYEYGDLPFDVRVDVKLAEACVDAATKAGVKSKPVNYDAFPIDSGSIVAANLLNPGGIPLIMTSNNLYHDGPTTAKLGGIVAECAARQNKRVAVIGVGLLSGGVFRQGINIEQDRLLSDADDDANRTLLTALADGKSSALEAYLPDYLSNTKADMGLKHLSWVMGALGNQYKGAETLAYGPCYGSGAAIIDFKI